MALLNQGMDSVLIQRIHALHSAVDLATHWRKQKAITADQTHLPRLKGPLKNTLKTLERGMKAQIDFSDTPKRLQLLQRFKKEAHLRIRTNRLTYRWWILFNFRLAILATPREYRRFKGYHFPEPFFMSLLESGDWVTHEGVERAHNVYPENAFDHLLRQFPKVVLTPVLDGEFGLIPSNQIALTRVYPLGLNTHQMHVDTRMMYPLHFFGHDITHAVVREKALNLPELSLSHVQAFHERFLQELSKLPARKRIQLEYYYFLITHERPLLFLDVVSIRTGWLFETRIHPYLKDRLQEDRDFNGWRGVLPSRLIASNFDTFFDEAGRAFVDLASKINQTLIQE